jgi:cyclopropane-fatty-acyl-phospholipid synthase
MKYSIANHSRAKGNGAKGKFLTKYLRSIARDIFHGYLKRLQKGKIVITDTYGTHVYGNDYPQVPLQAHLHIHDQQTYIDILLGGSVGAAEAYMDGSWDADDLVELVRIIALNAIVLDKMDEGINRLAAPMHWAYHVLRKNTLKGSRRNIAAHYDLGNDFYKLFLDSTMTYSCGVFDTSQISLEQAQINKYEKICAKMQIESDDRILEIGGGWGGFALYVARKYGCSITTTTISKNQFRYMQKLVRTAGLEENIRVILEDYRDINGKFDKIVSIEMIEAVGHHYLGTFLKACSDLLSPEGCILLQGITISDQRYKSHVRRVDFIKRYIFPGSCLTSPTALLTAVARYTDMRILHHEDITPHYGQTLKHWRRRFLEKASEVVSLGYSQEFIRMWEYYLAYCEGAFTERYIGDVQMVFAKPLSRISIV